MRILLSLGSFLVAAAPLGFFCFCIVQAVSEVGVVLAMEEIIGGWENIAILGGCLLFGAAFLIAGVAVLVGRPESAHETAG
jgi:hypothetical protein